MTGSPWGQEEQRTSENRGEGLFVKSLANSNSKESRSTYWVLVLGWALEVVFISLHTPLQWLLLLSVKRKWRTTEISNLPKVMHAEGQSEDSPQQWTGDFAFTNPGALSYSTWVCLWSPRPPCWQPCPRVRQCPGKGEGLGGRQFTPQHSQPIQESGFTHKGLLKTKTKTKKKKRRIFSSSFWFVSSRSYFFSHLVQTDWKRHEWFFFSPLKHMIKRTLGHLTEAQGLILGRVKTNRQQTFSYCLNSVRRDFWI